MKTGYVIAYAAAIILLLYCTAKAGKNNRAIAPIVQNLLIAAKVAVGANFVLTFCWNETVCMAAYNVFFASIDWLLYFLLVFIIKYTRKEIRQRNVKFLVPGLLALDSLSMLFNYVGNHVFSLKAVYSNGELYYRIIPHAAYRVHLLISYLLVGACLFYLVEKIILSPATYRKKYFFVLAAMFLVVAGDAAYVFLAIPVDISVIGFSLTGLLVYYYALVHVPRGVMQQMLSRVVQEMTDAVLLFDVEGTCLHANRSAEKLFKLIPGGVKKLEAGFREKSRELKPEFREDFERFTSGVREGQEYHFKMQFRRLLDKRNHYIGCFLLFQDRTKEENNLRRERFLATHDRLTGLYNKDYFYHCVRKNLNGHSQESFVIVCLDVEGFKLINDVFGTKTGDKLLIRIAGAVKKQAVNGELYGRLESDRFGIFMNKRFFDSNDVMPEVRKIECIEGGSRYPVHICIGIYEIMEQSIPISVMCDRAFMALNTIKGNYQQNLAFYDDTLRQRVLFEQAMTGELEEALETGQFQIYLQPQMTSGGAVHGAEALVRWLHPEKGLIPPGDFIEVFERNGLITKLDQYVWEQACIRLKKWKDEGRGDMCLSVNISSKDFYFADLYQIFTGLVERYGIKPGNLNLEITETAVMQDLEKQLDLIQRLRNYGFVVEMDDFGSGYSSLNMLKDIKVDILKIDMAFLGKTGHEERSRKILEMVVALSKELGVKVIIEGVEKEEQVAYLTEIGCDIFQGFYFARPMQISEFEHMLKMPA